MPGFMTQVTCRLTVKKRNQLRDPTLGNRVWAIFTFLISLLELHFRVLMSYDYNVVG